MPTCLYFGPQVGHLKVHGTQHFLNITFKRLPRGPKRAQERPKSGPRVPQGRPRPLPERPKRIQVTPKTAPGAPKCSQDPKTKVVPCKNTGKLIKAAKIAENIGSLSKNGQRLLIWIEKAQGQANVRTGNSFYFSNPPWKQLLEFKCKISAVKEIMNKDFKWIGALTLHPNWSNSSKDSWQRGSTPLQKREGEH